MRILDLFRAGSSTQSIVAWLLWTSNYQIRRPPTLRWPRTRPNTHEVGGDADSRNCTRGLRTRRPSWVKLRRTQSGTAEIREPGALPASSKLRRASAACPPKSIVLVPLSAAFHPFRNSKTWVNLKQVGNHLLHFR